MLAVTVTLVAFVEERRFSAAFSGRDE